MDSNDLRTEKSGKVARIIHLPSELVNRFQRLYPRMMTVFFVRCLILACQDKAFFDKVYFSAYDKYNSFGSNNPNYKVL